MLFPFMNSQMMAASGLKISGLKSFFKLIPMRPNSPSASASFSVILFFPSKATATDTTTLDKSAGRTDAFTIANVDAKVLFMR